MVRADVQKVVVVDTAAEDRGEDIAVERHTEEEEEDRADLVDPEDIDSEDRGRVDEVGLQGIRWGSIGQDAQGAEHDDGHRVRE